MQPPIPAGTLLQNRYRLLKVLGQGGFGRTYLAEDLSRFDERCVVKEYIPVQGGDYALQKSRELFQREAATLYQIQHPQIPQFRANFEQGRRLFFIQDFVDGQTYSTLLDERVKVGKTFTEGEILHLLEQALPVLHYIHSQGIVHRDISPDNLILRSRDRLPVLIDFGVVKEIAGQLQSQQSHQGTTVGKLGYSPSEQLQTGKVYPNSDLYALAVTAVVLMTGKQPQDLLDEATMTWHWQQRVPSLSPRLAQVLMRMMHPRPSNRYESATEILQALRSLTGLVQPASAPTAVLEELPVPKPSRQSNASLPVTTDPSATKVQATKVQPSKAKPPSTPPTWLPWVLGGTALLVIAVLPSVIIQSLLGGPPQLSVQPSPVNPELSPGEVSPNPEASPANPDTPPPPPSDNTNQVETEDVGLSPNQPKAEKSGKVNAQTTKRYTLALQEGQTFSVGVTKGSVNLEVKDPIGAIVSSGGSSAWQAPPSSRIGTYQITLSSVPETEFTVEFNLQGGTQSPASPTPSPQTSPSPTASPSPTPPPVQSSPSSGQVSPPGVPSPSLGSPSPLSLPTP